MIVLQMVKLYLWGNMFTGILPESWGQMSQVTSAAIASCCKACRGALCSIQGKLYVYKNNAGMLRFFGCTAAAASGSRH